MAKVCDCTIDERKRFTLVSDEIGPPKFQKPGAVVVLVWNRYEHVMSHIADKRGGGFLYHSAVKKLIQTNVNKFRHQK